MPGGFLIPFSIIYDPYAIVNKIAFTASENRMSREKFYDNIETRQNEILSATIVAVRFVFDKLSFSLQYCVQEPYEHVFSLV